MAAKVSVILPNFNHANFLDDRIQSILNQTFQDFELILLDDSSTDSSQDILKSYEVHSKVKQLIINEVNSGSTFKQWKLGLENAEGEYIWISESDDLADSTFLEYHITALENDKQLGASFSASTWIDENGKEIHEPTHEKDLTGYGSELLKSEFTKGNLIYNASSCVFRKALIPWKTLEQASNYKYCGDWLFWADLVAKTKINRTKNRLNYFRRHDQNVSFNAEANGLFFSEGFKIINHIFESQKFSFLEKQRLLFYWAQKLKNSKVENKKSLLSLLPFSAKISYSVGSLFNTFKPNLAS